MKKLEEVGAAASGEEADVANFYLKRMEVLRQLLQFGDQLLEMMVRGGAVDFARAQQMAHTVANADKSPQVEATFEVIDEEDALN
jgi:hypothetical protein